MINLMGKTVQYKPRFPLCAKEQQAIITGAKQTNKNEFIISVSVGTRQIKMQYPDAFESFLFTDDSEILADLQRIQKEEVDRKLLEQQIALEAKRAKEEAKRRALEESIRAAEEEEMLQRKIEKEICTNAHNYLTKERNVSCLIHFTTINNLFSILKSGILPRKELPETAEVMDQIRQDNMRDCSCFTVSFPNNLLFYKARNEHPDKTFVVLKIDPSIIKDKKVSDVFFTRTNAANRKYTGIIDQQTGLFHARDLFYDNAVETVDADGSQIEMTFREYLQIPSHYSTDPQAEILIRGVVGAEYIKKICVNSFSTIEELKQKLPPEYISKLELNSKYFGKRNDTQHWSNWFYG